MSGTGLRKCRPMNRSGRRVAAAMSPIERLDVFEAKIVAGGQIGSSTRQSSILSPRSSVTASTIRSQYCDLIVEAVTEDLGLKIELWRVLDPICPPATIFASNTSSLSIGDMAAATRRPERFIGLHFFNPVPLMPLVEVVRAVTTSPDVVERAVTFARRLGKEPIAARDRSGFVVNRLLVPYLLDAVRALEQGVASAADIDRGMQLGCGHPMGPLTLLDFVGLDTVVRIAEIMFDEYREAKYAPPSLLKRMVLAGMTGRKTGKGFYDYSGNPPKVSDLGL